MDFQPIYSSKGLSLYINKYFTKGATYFQNDNIQLDLKKRTTLEKWIRARNYDVWNTCKVSMCEMMWRNARFPSFYITPRSIATSLSGLTHHMRRITKELSQVDNHSTDIYDNPDYDYD